MILVTPELNVPMPTSMSPQEAKSIHEAALRAFNTVGFLQEMGADLDPNPTEADRKEAHALFNNAEHASLDPLTPGKALLLHSILTEYDVEVVRNSAQVRNYVKMRLLELTDSKKEAVQLKALELLGKMSDVQAFSERLEVNITHRPTADLEAELANKLSSYMKDIIDVDVKEGVSPERAELQALENAPSVQVINVDEELGLVGNELDDGL